MPSLHDPDKYWSSLPTIPKVMFDWLLAKGVNPLAVGSGPNPPLKLAHGRCADDGWFDVDPSGEPHIAILIEDSGGPIDVAFWHPRSGRVATLLNLGFALGEEQINNPGVYSFGGCLQIHANPLDWLRSGRTGIVVLDWTRAFDLLRYSRRIAIDEVLLPTYRTAMHPQHMPELFVMTDSVEAAA